MRHVLILCGLLAMFGSLTTVDAQNVLSLSGGEGAPGDSVTITVSLEVEDPVEAFEFDVCDTARESVIRRRMGAILRPSPHTQPRDDR